MTVTIELTTDTGRRLAERAGRAGRTVEALAIDLIARGVGAGPDLDAILAPFRGEVAASGIDDDELDALFEEARTEVGRGPAK